MSDSKISYWYRAFVGIMSIASFFVINGAFFYVVFFLGRSKWWILAGFLISCCIKYKNDFKQHEEKNKKKEIKHLKAFVSNIGIMFNEFPDDAFDKKSVWDALDWAESRIKQLEAENEQT